MWKADINRAYVGSAEPGFGRTLVGPASPAFFCEWYVGPWVCSLVHTELYVGFLPEWDLEYLWKPCGEL
jgi:hypothetical protein